MSKEEIETCKEELQNYIEFMESAGEDASWARNLKEYIKELEKQKKKSDLMQQPPPKPPKLKNIYISMKGETHE